MPKVLETKSIPRTLVIDKKGHIVIATYGAENWNGKLIHTLIKQLLSA